MQDINEKDGWKDAYPAAPVTIAFLPCSLPIRKLLMVSNGGVDMIANL